MKYSADHVDLGVLGGMGPRATHYFVGELFRAIETRRRPTCDQEYPNIVVRYACYLPDRTAAIESNSALLANALESEAQILSELGCPKIVIPCISAYTFAERFFSQFCVIDIPKAVAAYLQHESPKARVGILATRGARISGVVDKFMHDGQDVAVLALEDEEELMSFIYRKAKAGQAGNDASKLFELAEGLRQKGCDLIITGCTEVEMCLANNSGATNGFVFPLRIVADAFAADWTQRTA